MQEFRDAGFKYPLIMARPDGDPIVTEIDGVVTKALSAVNAWETVLEEATSEELRLILSNTMGGFNVDPEDTEYDGETTPRSFPAKMAVVLNERKKLGRAPIAFMPFELIIGFNTETEELKIQSEILLENILTMARTFGFLDADPDLEAYIREQGYLSTCIDRVCTEDLGELNVSQGEHPLRAVVEPFYELQITKVEGFSDHCQDFPGVQFVDDAKLYLLRKMVILNALHIAMVLHWRNNPKLEHVKTVFQALEEPRLAAVSDAYLAEAVHILDGHVDNPEGFAQEVLERFRNPKIAHLLEKIAGNLDTLRLKIIERLVLAYQFGVVVGEGEPSLLTAMLAAAPEVEVTDWRLDISVED